MTEEISKIGSSDGPTAVFVAGRNITFKQKVQRFINQTRRNHIAKSITADAHTLDEVCDYIVRILGYSELEADQQDYKEEYDDLRASYILQYKPELLEDLANIPDLTEDTEEAINEYLEMIKNRQDAAKDISKELFDIDFHKFIRKEGDNESHFVIEKTHDYIGGGASGNTKTVRRHNREFKQVYKYYGVTQEDIDKKTERFNDVVRTLAMPSR